MIAVLAICVVLNVAFVVYGIESGWSGWLVAFNGFSAGMSLSGLVRQVVDR